MLHENTLTEESADIFSATPKRYKLTENQIGVVLPFIKEYDRFSRNFVAFRKTEVFVEFNVYREFIIENFENEMYPVIHTYNEMYQDAVNLNSLFNTVRLFMEGFKTDTAKLTSNEINTHLSPTVKSSLQILLSKESQKISLARLWQNFVINIALLNLKSIIISGEYAQANLYRKDNRPVVPMKFIPKIGTELSVLEKNKQLPLTDIKTIINRNGLKNEFSEKLYINSLPTNEIFTLLDTQLSGTPINVDEIIKQMNYGLDNAGKYRLDESIDYIISRASRTGELLESANAYIDEMLDYIDTLTTLTAELKFISDKLKNYVITDFDFVNDYLHER